MHKRSVFYKKRSVEAGENKSTAIPRQKLLKQGLFSTLSTEFSTAGPRSAQITVCITSGFFRPGRLPGGAVCPRSGDSGRNNYSYLPPE
jgi:hypothetical protein